ncbi:MAG: S8 family serine peptidase, partial [Hyphomicrobiaceae bacterium]
MKGEGQGQSRGGINLPAAWSIAKGDRKIVVAVVDTGILFDHPDFKGSNNILRGYDFITDPFVANDGGGRDGDATDPGDACPFPQSPDSWHGSHVAGT